jgi:hypothetical protein
VVSEREGVVIHEIREFRERSDKFRQYLLKQDLNSLDAATVHAMQEAELRIAYSWDEVATLPGDIEKATQGLREFQREAFLRSRPLGDPPLPMK